MASALAEATSGEVVEWLMALVLKTSEVKASVGSNPTLSVSGSHQVYGPVATVSVILKSLTSHRY